MANPKYSKAKGRQFQNEVKELLLQTFTQFQNEDLKTAVMGQSGQDIHMSPHARIILPYSFECKRVQRLNIYKAIQQAKANAKEGITPAVVFRKNRMQQWIAIPFEKFLQLVGDKEEGG